MANLNENGRLQWVCPITGERRELRIGKFDDKAKRLETHGHIESLINSIKDGEEPKPAVIAWLKKKTPKFRDKLERKGLLGKTGGVLPTLEEQSARFLKTKASMVKEKSARIYGDTMRDAIAFWGKNYDVRNITTGSAKEFVAYLRTDRKPVLSEASAAKRAGGLSQFCRHLMDHEIITRNPFADKSIQKRAGARSEKRKIQVSPEISRRLVEYMEGADDELRAMFALCRWGGLRHGEARMMVWDQVDFKNKQIKILSPKTAGKGKASRVIPMFPEIERCLKDLHRDAEDKGPTAKLFPSYADKHAQCATMRLKAFIRAIGEKPWVCPWQNLRSTRENELIRKKIPSHLVHRWIGHTEGVAEEHYLDVLPEDYQDALVKLAPQEPEQESEKGAIYLPQKVPHLPSETGGNGQNPSNSLTFTAGGEIAENDGKALVLKGKEKTPACGRGFFRDPYGI